MLRLCDWWADRPWLTLAALTMALGIIVWPRFAEAGPSAAQPRPASALERQAAAAASSSEPTMSAELIQYLVRATLLSLDDANRTGNYSVMRDLAAPSFQQTHTAADLALIFTDFRKKGLHLSSAALLAPQLIAEPTLDKNDTLRLRGLLPSKPLRLVFDLSYQPVAGSWRLTSLQVTTEAANRSASAPRSTTAWTPSPSTVPGQRQKR